MDKASVFAPSLFQTPQSDFSLNNNTACAEKLDPSEMWLKRVSNAPVLYGDSNYSVVTNPNDPPMTCYEKEKLYDSLDPISIRTLEGGGVSGTLPSMLFATFFSRGNYHAIQKLIKIAVFKYSGYRIGDQSFQELQNVMQSIFRDYSTVVDEFKTSRKALLSFIKNEVARLDDLIISAVVPTIVNQVEQRVSLNTFVESNNKTTSYDRPIADNIYGQISYRPITDILACTTANCPQTRT